VERRRRGRAAAAGRAPEEGGL